MSGRALIVGAGIGGLTAALAIRRAGRDVEVYERAPEIGEVGAGITVQPNAIAALRALDAGLARAVIEAGHVPERIRILDPRGHVLSELNTLSAFEEVGAVWVALHRAALQRILYDAVGCSEVRIAAEAIGFEAGPEAVTLRLRDGSSSAGAILVGADGLRSVIRAQLLRDGAPRYAGYTTWRGVAEGFGEHRFETTETWGCGRRFGVVPIGDGRVYWYAALNAPASGHDAPAEPRAKLSELFGGWHPPIAELLSKTAGAAIVRTDIADRRKASRWSAGRVTLLGDAAHPMTPDLGQGACQAIEDAVVLGRCLAKQPVATLALLDYDRLRRDRADHVVSAARHLGRVAQLENRFACAVRDAVVRWTPQALNRRRMLRLWSFD
jgi:2-polyprenyl-6-methoxyphenol hydroxylase-like FAD-dependent oxidoreductase